MTLDRIIDAAMRPVADAVAGFIFFTVPVLGADLPLISLPASSRARDPAPRGARPSVPPTCSGGSLS